MDSLKKHVDVVQDNLLICELTLDKHSPILTVGEVSDLLTQRGYFKQVPN